ncbi:MAG: NAD(P)/FAD-dependent oxidoreductase [Elusimicrobiales bacterium]
MQTTEKYDALIIGAGVTGAAIARELSKYKLRILLLEKEAEPAFGVSKSNSGIIHAGTQNPPDSLKGRLCVQGNRLIREIARELGVHFVEVGQLIVVFSESDVPELEKIKREGEELGIENMSIVRRDWLAVHEPNLSPDIPAALYVPSAGIISPYRLVYDLTENAVKNGAVLKTSHKVTGIKRLSGGPHRFEVEAAGDRYQARFLINAAGLFADKVSAMAGVADFKITPRKGEEYLLDKKRENMANHLVFPLPTPTSKGILIIKTSDGNPMIGPTASETGDRRDLSTTDEGFREVLAGARKMMPSVEKGDIIAYFAGLRPAAGKDFIIRHESAAPGLVNVAGIQSPGLTAAPAIAVMVAGLLKDNGLVLTPKKNFHSAREKTTHLFEIPLSRTRELIQKDPAYGDIVCRCEMVSAKEIRDAIRRGARTMDGIKFRTRAQAGRCHGGFCTTRIMKIMQEELGMNAEEITKRGEGSELVREERRHE